MICPFFTGTKSDKPIRPNNDKSFSVYLSGRGMDESGFMRWIYGHSPNKSYFPFISDIYQGKISSYMRDVTSEEVVGIIIGNVSKSMSYNSGTGLINVKTSENDNQLEKVTKKPTAVDEDKSEEPAPPGMEIEETLGKEYMMPLKNRAKIPKV